MSPAFFREGNKDGWGDHAILRMLPAQESFKADDLARLQAHLRLILQRQLTPLQGAVQAVCQDHAVLDLRLHFGGAERVLVGPAGFCPVHGDIGVFNEGLDILAVVWIDSDAGAGRDEVLLTANPEGGGEQAHDSVGDFFDLAAVGQIVEQNQKFVSAEARDGVGFADVRGERLGDLAEDVVAPAVTHRVVEGFKAVEVEKYKAEHSPPAPRQMDGLGGAVVEQQTVRKPGELGRNMPYALSTVPP